MTHRMSLGPRWLYAGLAIILFGVFAGNIALALTSQPLLSAVWEFVTLLTATLAAVLYLLCEEYRKYGAEGPRADPLHTIEEPEPTVKGEI